MHGRPHKHWSIHYRHVRRWLWLTRVLSSLRLALSNQFEQSLLQKTEAAPKLRIVTWLLEFHWEVKLNSMKEQYTADSIKVNFCWQSAKIFFFPENREAQYTADWGLAGFIKQNPDNDTGCYNLPALHCCLQNKCKRGERHFGYTHPLYFYCTQCHFLTTYFLLLHVHSYKRCLKTKMAAGCLSRCKSISNPGSHISIRLLCRKGTITNWHLLHRNWFLKRVTVFEVDFHFSHPTQTTSLSTILLWSHTQNVTPWNCQRSIRVIARVVWLPGWLYWMCTCIEKELHLLLKLLNITLARKFSPTLISC